MYHLRCAYTALPICCCPEGRAAAAPTGKRTVDHAASAAAAPAAAAAASAASGTRPSAARYRAEVSKKDSSPLARSPRLVAAETNRQITLGAPAVRALKAPVVADFLSVGREVARQRRLFLRALKGKTKQQEFCMLCELNEVDPACSPFAVCGKCRYTKHLRRPLQQQRLQQPHNMAPLSAATEDEEEDPQEPCRRQQQQAQSKRRFSGLLWPVASSTNLGESDSRPPACHLQHAAAGYYYGNRKGGKSTAPTESSMLLTALLSACTPSSGGGGETASPTAASKDSSNGRAAAGAALGGAGSRSGGRALQEKQRRLRFGDYLSVGHGSQRDGKGKEKHEEKGGGGGGGRERVMQERGQTAGCQMRRCKRSRSDPTDMLTCCTCGLTSHASCCDPPLRFETVNRFPWQCPDCKLCVVCEYNVSEETMLICDSCDRAYHMECLKPPVLEIPEGKWFCADCWTCCSSCGKELSQDDSSDEGSAAADGGPLCRSCAEALPPRVKRPRGLGNASTQSKPPMSTPSSSPSSCTPSSRQASAEDNGGQDHSSSSSCQTAGATGCMTSSCSSTQPDSSSCSQPESCGGNSPHSSSTVIQQERQPEGGQQHTPLQPLQTQEQEQLSHEPTFQLLLEDLQQEPGERSPQEVQHGSQGSHES